MVKKKYNISKLLYKKIREKYILESKPYYSHRMSEDDFISYSINTLNYNDFFIHCFKYLMDNHTFTVSKNSIKVLDFEIVSDDFRSLIFEALEKIIKENNENIF